jgi:hypothetical protein
MSTGFGDGIPLPPASRVNRHKLISRVGLCSVAFVFLFISSIILTNLFTKKSRLPSSPVTSGTMRTPSTSLSTNEELSIELPTISKNLCRTFYIRTGLLIQKQADHH